MRKAFGLCISVAIFYVVLVMFDLRRGHAESDNVDSMPSTFRVGVGVEMTSVADPVVASVRLRLGNGIALEPWWQLGRIAEHHKLGSNDSESKRTTQSGGFVGRFPLHSRGKTEFLATLGMALGRTRNISDLSDNTKETVFEVEYGLSANYWVSRHWCLGVDVVDSLYRRTRFALEERGDITTTSQAFAWSPTGAVTVHLYY